MGFTYSIGTNSVSAGSRIAITQTVLSSQLNQLSTSGVSISLPFTLTAGTTVWIYATEISGATTSQLSFSPIATTTVSITGFNPSVIPLATEIFIQANVQNIDASRALVFSYNTTGFNNARTVVRNITAGSLQTGALYTFPVSFAYSTTYYFFISDAVSSATYTQTSVALGASPTASLSITDIQTFIGTQTVQFTPTFLNISASTVLSLFINTTNANSGGTKLIDVAGVKQSGVNLSFQSSFTMTAGTTYYFYLVMGATTSATFTYTPVYVTLNQPTIIYGDKLLVPITTNATAISSVITLDTALYVYVKPNADQFLNALYASTTCGSINGNIVTRSSTATLFPAVQSNGAANQYYISLLYIPNGVDAAGNPIGSYTILSKITATADFVPDSYPPLPISSTNNIIASSPSLKYGAGQYIVTSSSTLTDPYNAFLTTQTMWNANGYDATTGLYTGGSVSTTLLNGTIIYGQWLQLAFPRMVSLYSLTLRVNRSPNAPTTIALLTSADGNNWNINQNFSGNLDQMTSYTQRTLFIMTKGGVQCNYARIVFLSTQGAKQVVVNTVAFTAIGSSKDAGDPLSKISYTLPDGSAIDYSGYYPTFRLLSVSPPTRTMTLTSSNITNISCILTATNINSAYINSDVVSIYQNPYDPNNLATNLVALTNVATLRAGYLLNQFTANTVYNLVFITSYALGTIPTFTTLNNPFTLTVSNQASTSARITATSVDNVLPFTTICSFSNITNTITYFTCTVSQLLSGFVLTGLTPSTSYTYYVFENTPINYSSVVVTFSTTA